MAISMRADYAARALIDLSERYGAGWARSADIAQRRHIPEAFVEQLLGDLRKAGLVRSVRGPAGGYQLALSPPDITLAQVFRALGEKIAISNRVENRFCIELGNCVLEKLWNQIADACEEVLEGVTLNELLGEQISRGAREMYYI